MEATRIRDEPSTARRSASVDQGHPETPGGLRFRPHCARIWTNRSGDRNTAQRNRGSRRRSSPHPREISRRPGRARHDACGNETVTNADTVREPRRFESDVAAQATAGKPLHDAPPAKRSTDRVGMQSGRDRPLRHARAGVSSCARQGPCLAPCLSRPALKHRAPSLRC
jgi:hypothetical protein